VPNPIAAGDEFAILKQITIGYNAYNGYYLQPINLSHVTVGTTLSPSYIKTHLTHPNGFFNGGTITFDLGVAGNMGQTRNVLRWENGAAILETPFPFVQAAGDIFTIRQAGAAVEYATCGFYNNTARFGGFPYIPAPETAV